MKNNKNDTKFAFNNKDTIECINEKNKSEPKCNNRINIINSARSETRSSNIDNISSRQNIIRTNSARNSSVKNNSIGKVRINTRNLKNISEIKNLIPINTSLKRENKTYENEKKNEVVNKIMSFGKNTPTSKISIKNYSSKVTGRSFTNLNSNLSTDHQTYFYTSPDKNEVTNDYGSKVAITTESHDVERIGDSNRKNMRSIAKMINKFSAKNSNIIKCSPRLMIPGKYLTNKIN